MIKHVVMWKFKESAGGRSKEENLDMAVKKFRELPGQIPEILDLQVGRDICHTEASYDLVLMVQIQDKEALERYSNHQSHREAGKFVTECRTDRMVCDIELS